MTYNSFEKIYSPVYFVTYYNIKSDVMCEASVIITTRILHITEYVIIQLNVIHVKYYIYYIFD